MAVGSATSKIWRCCKRQEALLPGSPDPAATSERWCCEANKMVMLRPRGSDLTREVGGATSVGGGVAKSGR
jgi:hypothetical protein